MKKRPIFILRLIAFELIISGVVSAAITAIQRYEVFLAMSLLGILTGGLCLRLATRPILTNKFEAVVSSRFGKIVSFTPVALLGLFLSFFEPSKATVLSISSLLLSTWLIGLQLIWFGGPRLDETPGTNITQGNRLSLLALLFVCGFLLIPSRVPSLLSGIPLDQPIEFVVATLLMPIAWIINRRFFSNKTQITIFLVLLVIKSLIWVLLPQSGMGARVFTSPQAVSNGQWMPSYTTWLNSSYSNIMQSPYKSMREFPVEWVNNHFGFDFDQFWMTLEVNGTIHIYDEGRLVFVIRGAKQVLIEMVDSNTGTKISAVFVNDSKTLDASLYHQLPEYNAFDLSGTVLYTKFGEARLEPVLLYPDGSVKPLFENASVWPSQVDMPSQSQAVFFENLLNFLALVFIVLICFGIIQGFTDLYSRNELSTADIYLAFSSLGAYYLSALIEKPQAPFVIVGILITIAIVKLLDFKFSPSHPNLKSYIVFVGIIFLFGYLTLDINNLRSITTLPKGQDGLEYQTFARNIFVYRDIFLKQTPPRAYKILFPYVVGLLHTIFGQSSAAQFLLNAWCAVLSAALAFTLAKKFQLPLPKALLTSISFIIIISLPSSYIYYFRFGLMEPIAVLFLFITMIHALKRRLFEMRMSAIITVLLRLDYLGLIIVTIILRSSPLIGDMKSVWSELLKWIRRNNKDIILHIFIIAAIPALVIASYFIFIENYMLNAGDTFQFSLWSMIGGFMRVLVGGNLHDFQKIISQNSFGFLLITTPLAIGFIISLLSIFYRQGIFSKIDLRLAILVPSILPVYIVVRPTGYFSRFSFPILALDIILIGMFLYQCENKEATKSLWKTP